MPTLYNEEVSSLVDGPWTEENQSLVASMPTYDTVKNRLYKARRSTFPAIPTTRRDILIPDEYKTTDAGEPFVIINDGEDNKILGMTTTSNLEHLCAADVIYGDGTFYVEPSLFLQLYTLHAMVGGQMFPLVFFLLPNKTKETYNRAFRLLKEAAVARGMQLLPQCVQMEYELAAKDAVANNFPTATWKGCLFHYTQCIWRKTQAVGLQTVYNHDEEVTRFVRRAAVLPLMPEGRVEDVWLNALADMPDDPRCLQLADYVTTYWIEGDVPLATWNHFQTTGPRTNNHLEGWHGRLKKIVAKAYPNVFEMLAFLRNEQKLNEIKLVQYGAGQRLPPKRRKYCNMNSRIGTLKQSLQNGTMSVFVYADTVSHLLKVK